MSNKVKTLLKNFEERLAKLEESMAKEMGDFKRKQEEIELNTYWKIKDYEDLLGSRITETFMKDYMAAEFAKA
jgi:hypothetical protein